MGCGTYTSGGFLIPNPKADDTVLFITRLGIFAPSIGRGGTTYNSLAPIRGITLICNNLNAHL